MIPIAWNMLSILLEHFVSCHWIDRKCVGKTNCAQNWRNAYADKLSVSQHNHKRQFYHFAVVSGPLR